LPPTRQLNLTGAQSNRGFDRGLYLSDRGVSARLELRQPVTLGEFFLFSDVGYGTTVNDRADTWGHVSSIGVGWDADLMNKLTSRLSLGLPLAAEARGGLDNEGPRLYWSLEYAY
jgi:hemolysin activation/secretion protein